jgi:hypothetical protein
MKVKTIDIQAKEWFDKVNGNSYFAGKVIVNYGMPTEQEFKMPFQYGYGSQYEQEARQILAENNLIPVNDYGRNGKSPKNNHELRELGIIIRSSITHKCKKTELTSI